MRYSAVHLERAVPDPSEDRRALYLRWRPLTFADVVGQEHVVQTLRNAIAAGSPAHAYLFCGPRGTGKTSLARILFRAVNCLDTQQGDACGRCLVCRTALEGRSLDLVEIDAASNRGIDDIRELREKVAFAPASVRYRVYIVDEAHELTAPAWDAFLKTLEEPPPHAIFVLATTEAHKVPSTIVSRCQRFDLRRIRPEAIKQRLLEIAVQEGLTLEPTAAERLARMARGGLRDAISLLDQAASFTAGRVDLEALRDVLGLVDTRLVQQLLEHLARGSAPAALALTVDVAEAGADLRLFAEELTGQLRGLLFTSVGGSSALSAEFSADDRAWLESEAPAWDPQILRGLLRALADGLARIRDGAQFQLHLELALLEACAGRGQLVEPLDPPRGMNETERPAPRGVDAAVAPSSPPVREAVIARPEDPPAPLPLAVEPPEQFDRPVWSADLDFEPESLGPAVTSRADPLVPAPAIEDLEALREAWPKVIEWVGHRSPFVASYLRPAELSAFRDGNLVLTFSFRLHHERVAEARNRGLVEQGCAQVFGQPLRVFCEYAQAIPSTSDTPLDLEDPLLKLALERFGGRAEWLDV
jgi:DNA polymerase III subunit gamma/tau